jgi:hypothetical protein
MWIASREVIVRDIMAVAKKNTIPADKMELYEKLVATIPETGRRMPVSS